MANAADPKFTPAAASLAVVDMKVTQIRTDEALIEFVRSLAETRELTDAQEAVAVYTARKRGHEFDWILSNLGLKQDTAARREIEGMAILRLSEVTRTVAAIRVGSLGVKVVDEITSKPISLTADGVDQRIIDLEIMAAGKKVASSYMTEGKKPLNDEQVAAVVKQAIKTVEAKVEPLNAASIVAAVPSFSETVGLTRKETPRTPSTSNTGPMGLEFHIKAALRDIAALEKAAEEPYVLTTHDYKALFDLVTRFGLVLEPTEDLARALEVAEKAGL
jgi:hypothetical protein